MEADLPTWGEVPSVGPGLDLRVGGTHTQVRQFSVMGVIQRFRECMSHTQTPPGHGCGKPSG